MAGVPVVADVAGVAPLVRHRVLLGIATADVGRLAVLGVLELAQTNVRAGAKVDVKVLV